MNMEVPDTFNTVDNQFIFVFSDGEDEYRPHGGGPAAPLPAPN